MQIIDLQLYLKTVTLTQIFSIHFLVEINYSVLNGLVAYSYTDFNTRSDARKDFFHKVTGQQLWEAFMRGFLYYHED